MISTPHIPHYPRSFRPVVTSKLYAVALRLYYRAATQPRSPASSI